MKTASAIGFGAVVLLATTLGPRSARAQDGTPPLAIPDYLVLDAATLSRPDSSSGGTIGAQASGLTFNLIAPGAIDPRALAGFNAAAANWSSLLGDDMSVNLAIDFRPLGAGIIGQTGSMSGLASYADVRGMMAQDATSPDDALAAGSLPAGPAVSLLLNGTSNNPNGVGSRTPYLDNDGDANNRLIRLTTANAKALGFTVTYDPVTNPNALDARISFNSTLGIDFDFDPSDGINAGTIDFVGLATHEIGHALGFISGIDVLDLNSPQNTSAGPVYFPDDQFTFINPLDLFRYTTTSAALGVPNFTLGTFADVRTPPVPAAQRVEHYFSLDRGATRIAPFATGVNFGDRNQASHWRDSPRNAVPLGIMDPSAGPGELLVFSANDARAFDVIGYNLRATQIPEPSSLALLGLGGGLGASLRVIPRRRRRSRFAARRP